MNKNQNKTILIAGGAGFIGSNLCCKLINNPNNSIICIDNLSSGRIENIEHLLNLENFKFIKHDIVENIKGLPHLDEIYNFACPASPPFYQKQPISTIMTNVVGTKNLLDLAKENNAIFLQASTSEVYGDPTIPQQHEGYNGNVNPHGIRACYDEGKRCAETLCMDYYRQYGVNVKIIRIFNTYGPGMRDDDGRVISNFIVSALSNKPITIYGDGSQTRSFQYITDLLNGIELFMQTPSYCTGPMNIGNPSETTIITVANKIKKLTNSQSEIIFLDIPKDDPKRRKPDISFAKSLLGWKPIVDFNNGIKKTINYFKQQLWEN